MVSYRDHEIGARHSRGRCSATSPRSTACATLRLEPLSRRGRARPGRRHRARRRARARAHRRQPVLRHRGGQGPRPSAARLGPRRRAGPTHRRSPPTTSRCCSSWRRLRTGSTTGCSRPWASTCRRCGGCDDDRSADRAPAEASSSATSSPARRSRARSRRAAAPAARAAARCARARSSLREPAVLTHHAVAARDARPRGAVRTGGSGRGDQRRRAQRGGRLLRDRAGAPRRRCARSERDLLLAARLRAVHDQPARPRRSTTSGRRSRCGRPSGRPPGWPPRTSRRDLRVLQRAPAPGRGARGARRRGSPPTTPGPSRTAPPARRSGYLAYMRSDIDARAASCVADGAPHRRRARPGLLALRSDIVRDRHRPGQRRRRRPRRAGRPRSTARAPAAGTSSRRLATRSWRTSTSSTAGSARPSTSSRSRCPFAVERDIPICQPLADRRAVPTALLQGRWSAALEDAERVLDETGMPLATLWPHLVAALVPMRPGRRAPARTSTTRGRWPSRSTSRSGACRCCRHWPSACG